MGTANKPPPQAKISRGEHLWQQRSCTGSTSQNVSSTSWESQFTAVCSTVQGSCVPGRLYCNCTPSIHPSTVSDIPTRRHLRSATRRHLTVPQNLYSRRWRFRDRTTLPAQQFRSSGLLCRRSDGLELATRQSVSVTRRLAATALNNRWRRTYFVAIPPSTHSAVDTLYDSVLYRLKLLLTVGGGPPRPRDRQTENQIDIATA